MATDNGKKSTAAAHSDTPPARPEVTTGAGREATIATDGSAAEHDREHKSGYGGKGGKPDNSSAPGNKK